VAETLFLKIYMVLQTLKLCVLKYFAFSYLWVTRKEDPWRQATLSTVTDATVIIIIIIIIIIIVIIILVWLINWYHQTSGVVVTF
jgi:hypothetical protein